MTIDEISKLLNGINDIVQQTQITLKTTLTNLPDFIAIIKPQE